MLHPLSINLKQSLNGKKKKKGKKGKRKLLEQNYFIFS